MVASIVARNLPKAGPSRQAAGMRGKTVCLVSHNCYHRDTRVRRYADHLVSCGANVHILCPPCRCGYEKPDADSHLEVTNIPMPRLYSGRWVYLVEYVVSYVLNAVYLAFLHLRYHFDLVQVHNGPDILIWAALLPKLLGARLILDLRDPMPELYQTKYGQHRRVVHLLGMQERISGWLADAIITANTSFCENIIRRGTDASKITVITNAPDSALFGQPMPKETERLKHGYVLLYSGTIAPRYGLDTAIRAMPDILEAIPSAQLRIVGPRTAYCDELERLTECLGVSGQVVFKGSIPLAEVPFEISRADVGIYPAIASPHTRIATPCKALEWAAMGLPVVASRLPILERLFGPDGLCYFPSSDSRMLADRVVGLYQNPALRESFVRLAGTRYASLPQWEAESAIYDRLVGDLLGCGGLPSQRGGTP